MFDITLFAFTCFIAAMFQSLSGFGSGIVSMSILPHFFQSYPFSLSLTTFSSLVICFYIIIKEYRHANIRMVMPVVAADILATTLIMLFWNGDAGSVMKKALGVFLVLLSLYFIFFKDNIKIKPALKTGLLSGALGGVLNALFSTGGPPVVVYMMNASENPREYLASIQMYFCLSSTYVTISRYMRGMIAQDIWPLFLTGLPFIILGTWAGLKLFGVLNERVLRFIIYIFMALSGAVMIFS